MNITELRPFNPDFVVVGQWDKTPIFLTWFDVAKTDHINFECWTADSEKSVSEISLFLGLTVTCDTLLHAFGNAILYNWESETNFMVRNDSTDSVLAQFELTQRIRRDDISNVGDVAVPELVIASLHS